MQAYAGRAMHFDVRTRIDGPRPVADPGDFFTRELPAALEAGAAGIAPGLELLEPRTLTIEVEDEAWTLTADRRHTARGVDHIGP